MIDPSTLLYDPFRGFRVWNITQLYLGPNTTGSGRIVPLVDDMVIDWDVGTYRVTDLDVASWTPTLELVDLSMLTQQSLSNRPGRSLPPYQPSVMEMAFVNTQVVPFTVNIDDRYVIYGEEAVYAKLFKGTDLTEDSGVVISQLFNGSGQFVSENIPLELIDSANPAMKRPPEFNTNTALFDRDLVSLVIYNQSGGAIGQHQFLVRNTNIIRGLGQNTVYITDVQLVSPLLDSQALDLINAPQYMPLLASDFQARLIYSDGSSALIAVGTAKCKLHGLETFNTSLPGSLSKVTLTYYPDVNEPAVNISNPALRSISHIYNIHTVENVLDYTFKVYVVPKYNVGSQTFSLEYYLTNLAYNLLVKLQPSQYSVSVVGGGTVSYVANGPEQHLRISVNMDNVLPFNGYTGYNFVQLFTVRFGTAAVAPWLLDYTNTGVKVYGVQPRFGYSILGQQAIDVQVNAVSIEEWFARLYEPLHPIYDESLRLAPPTPTHFRLSYKGLYGPIRSCEDYWNLLLPNDFGQPWTEFDTVLVIWLNKTADPDVYYETLAVSPVIIQNSLT